MLSKRPAATGASSVPRYTIQLRPEALTAQAGLYTVEYLGQEARYRIVGAIKGAAFAPAEPEAGGLSHRRAFNSHRHPDGDGKGLLPGRKRRP